MRFSFVRNKLVIIGGSAGSMQPLITLLGALPATIEATIILVLHRQRNVSSRLVEIFSHYHKAPVSEPEDKEPLLPGHIYLAPQNYHLLLEAEGNFALEYSEPVCYSRPSIDVTMQSAALTGADNNLLAILLSGANADGAAGIQAVLEAGGNAAVQAPALAEFPVMPEAALAQNPKLIGASLAEISGKLNQFVC